MRKSGAGEVSVGPRFYSVAQVAEMFGMSAMTVYRAISAGELSAVRIRGRLIVPARVVDELVEAAVAQQSGLPVLPVAAEGA